MTGGVARIAALALLIACKVGGSAGGSDGATDTGTSADGDVPTALPRVAARSASPAGQFFLAIAGAPAFTPRGYDWTVYDASDDAHVTFSPGRYDAAAVDAMLSALGDDGMTTVRVLLDYHAQMPSGAYGIAGPATTTTAELYAPYVANVIDFLRRARAHGIHVVIALLFVPQNQHYFDIIAANAPAGVTGTNLYYLSSGGIAAKTEYATAIVQAVAHADAGALLSTVMAWEIENEVNVVDNAQPFSSSQGLVTTADGSTYDMASANDRQLCADANIVHWANAVAAAVRAIDADALVSASVFTYGAVGRPGPSGLPAGQSPDPRFPARPYILGVYSTLSFLDFHVYPRPGSYSLDGDLATSEYGSIDRTTRPIFLGEFGAYRARYATPAEAAPEMVSLRAATFAAGFGGALLWTWDTSTQPELWSAADGGSAIRNALR